MSFFTLGNFVTRPMPGRLVMRRVDELLILQIRNRKAVNQKRIEIDAMRRTLVGIFISAHGELAGRDENHVGRR